MARSRRSRYAEEYRLLLLTLVAERKRRGVTQDQLAAHIETSQSVLSKLERGVVRMDLMDVLEYLEGIGSDPISFLSDYIREIRTSK